MHHSNVVFAWSRAVQADMNAALGQVGLEQREVTALTLVGQHDGCSLEWLQHRVGLTQSGTVRLVDRLSGRRLIERVAAPGRSVPLRLTDAGREVLDAWAGVRDRAADDVLAALNQPQREQFLNAIRVALLNTPRDRRTADATCGACTWLACGSDCPVDHSVDHDREA
jgi:DNA-binding MarR family transcriptional regulator